LVQLIGWTSPADRPALLGNIGRAFPQLDIERLAPDAAPAAEQQEPEGRALRDLRRELGPGFRLFPVQLDGMQQAGIALPDGAMISTRLIERPQRTFWGSPWMAAVMLVIVSLALFGLWAERALSTPLSSFAKSAENFNLDGNDPPLPENGPDEIRALARALNRSRERITALIDDRTRMLAAISHDLRTPITRLRLRCEFIEDVPHRTNMLRDLNQMHSMLEAVLSFLRNGRKLEPMTLIDLSSTLQLVTDQFADIGHKVRYDGPEHAMATARPDDINRAVTNLVENAVRFGTEATIRLRTTAETIVIEVEDDGPGISDSRKDSVLQPFVRGDDARNMDDAPGFGLGLAIARAIVKAHGGELTLLDRKPHGLIARIELQALAQGSKAA
jgi:signal transduction histidine kinase